jgi:hypothetical protein
MRQIWAERGKGTHIQEEGCSHAQEDLLLESLIILNQGQANSHMTSKFPL